MPANRSPRHRLYRWVYGGTVWLLCVISMTCKVSEAQPVGISREQADANLKTCLEYHYDADADGTAYYHSGKPLMRACGGEWAAAQSACMNQHGETVRSCEAQDEMVLLGFVPMR